MSTRSSGAFSDRPEPRVVAVNRRRGHHFSKTPQLSITLLEGLGVEGDGHMGATVRHRYDISRDPSRPNLRQVHLMQSELFDELRSKGFAVGPGDLGENVTTVNLDLMALPSGTRLRLGASAVIEITGLREPCVLIDRFQPGLMAAMLDHAADGTPIPNAGIMAVVVTGGPVQSGDPVQVECPPPPLRPLQPV